LIQVVLVRIQAPQRSHRLEAKDATLSRSRHGFESRWDHSSRYVHSMHGRLVWGKPGREANVNLDEVIDGYHRAADEFSRGDPEPVKALYSRRDDATLANPFVGPPVRGWTNVANALDFASSRFRGGEVSDYKAISRIEGGELAVLLEIEEWKARVGDRSEISPFTLRVTTVFRSENGTWRIVHRHADPISTPDTSGPLRAR
jgi:ketosteroid isomerase-like protein